MRKILLSAALAAICTMGMTAMASETSAVSGTYTPGANSYNASITDTTAQTIIIYKVSAETDGEVPDDVTITGDSIYYVDQSEASTGFNGSVNALMKSGATAGTYVVAVQGGDYDTFVISTGDEAVEGCIPAKSLAIGEAYEDANGYCSVAFKIENITYAELSALQTVKSRVGDWVVATGITDVIGDWMTKDGEVPNIDAATQVYGLVQVDWVPVDKAENFELYFAADATPQA